MHWAGMDDDTQAQSARLRHDQAQPKVSCLWCREQKLKCSRNLPSCMRCRRQKVHCTYPPPPDRKRIAQRVSEAKALKSNSIDLGQLIQRQPLTNNKSSKRQRTQSEDYILVVVPNPSHSPESTAVPDANEAADLPSTEIGLLLLEVYFKRVYNATLMFHKAMLFELYRQNVIPDYLLRTIFAHAAVFLQNFDNVHKGQVKTPSMHNIFEKSWSWARSASKEVLSYADEPTLTRIQTLQVLQLYYFSQDDIKRAKIHLSLAYRLSQLLEYPTLREEPSSDRNSQHLIFKHEMQRRCYWAIWCSISMGAPTATFESLCNEVVGLPLPARLESNSLLRGEELDLGPRMMFNWESSSQSLRSITTAPGSPPQTLMTELIKFLGVWTNIKEFVSAFPTLPQAEQTSQFERLVARAETIRRSSNLSISDLCSEAESIDESPELLVSIYSSFLLGQLFLHIVMCSSYVDTMPGPLENGMSQKCSRKVLEYANAFTKLLLSVFEQNLDISRLWPLTGYGAFVVGKIFAIYRCEIQNHEPTNYVVQIPDIDSVDVKAIQTVLEVSSVFWKPLRKFTNELKQANFSESPNNFDSVIPITYPWEAAYPERLPEYPIDTILLDEGERGASKTSESSPRNHDSTMAPEMQRLGQQNNTFEQLHAASNHQVPLNPSVFNANPYQDSFNVDHQFADKNLFMNSTDKSLTLETNLWDVISGDPTQDFIFSSALDHP